MDQQTYPIEVDIEAVTWRCGSYVAETDLWLEFPPRKEKDLSLKKRVLEANGIEVPKVTKTNAQEVHKLIAKHIGPAFNKAVASLGFKYLVLPVKDLAFKYCMQHNPYRSIVKTKALRSLHRNLDVTTQAERDGLTAIIPWLLQYEASPNQFKAFFGSGIWKTLLKTAKSRSAHALELFSDYANSAFNGAPFFGNEEFKDDARSLLREVLNLDTKHMPFLIDTIGICGYLTDPPLQLIIHEMRLAKSRFPKGVSLKGEDGYEHLHREYEDALRMAEELNVPFKLLTSDRSISEWHRELNVAFRQKELEGYKANYSDESYLSTQQYRHAAQSIDTAANIRLLDSSQAIHSVSWAMVNCLWSYEDLVSTGQCLLFEFNHCGLLSVVSFSLIGGRWQLGQFEFADNKAVPSGYMKSEVEALLKEINKIRSQHSDY